MFDMARYDISPFLPLAHTAFRFTGSDASFGFFASRAS